MAYIHECDMCGARFENGFQMNVVSFFERNRNPLEVVDEEKYGIQFKIKHVPLKEANPRLELCDECFDYIRNNVLGILATSDIFNKPFKMRKDYRRSENEREQ